MPGADASPNDQPAAVLELRTYPTDGPDEAFEFSTVDEAVRFLGAECDVAVTADRIVEGETFDDPHGGRIVVGGWRASEISNEADVQADAVPDGFDPTTLAGAVAQCVADRLDPQKIDYANDRMAVACKRIAAHYGDGDWVVAEETLWESEFAPLIDRVSEGAAAHGTDALANAARLLADEDADNDAIRDALIDLVAVLEGAPS